MNKQTLISPEGKIQLTLTECDGRLFWEVYTDGRVVLDPSMIGLCFQGVDMSSGFTFQSVHYDSINETYCIPSYKKAVCRNDANRMTAVFVNASGALIVQCHAGNSGAAIRMSAAIGADAYLIREKTTFALPSNRKAVYGMRYLFTYEDRYTFIPPEELTQNRFAFPVLIQCADDLWALYTEAQVTGAYGGSNLLATDKRTFSVDRPPDEDHFLLYQSGAFSPWRVVMAGSLNDICTTELLENLNPSSMIKDNAFIVPGMAAWSIFADRNIPRDFDKSCEYIEYAKEMGFKYYLIDEGWAGNVDICALAAFAKRKGVGLLVWMHRNQLATPDEVNKRIEKFAAWGVAGLKVDFFESDRPERIAQMELLLEVTARHRMVVAFHGCTKPTGQLRQWPHLLTCEGVMGAEFHSGVSGFLPNGPTAEHNCMLPFTRNAVGPMDYTPFVGGLYQTGTTLTHQAALLIVFVSYIQHLIAPKEDVLSSPMREFLSTVPTTWDESQLLEGFPGHYVTFARKKDGKWYVAGICALRPRVCHLKLDFLDEGLYDAVLYTDGFAEDEFFDTAQGVFAPLKPQDYILSDKRVDPSCNLQMRRTVHNHDMNALEKKFFETNKDALLHIPMAVNGGFVLELQKA